MAQTAILINLKGGEKLRRALRNPKFVQGPASRFVRRIAFNVQAEAVKAAPSDTGRLRQSITPQFDRRNLRARVGTNLKYGRPVEFGSRPHWPPLKALQPWARRHGFPGGKTGAFLVARAISRKGTKPRRYLGKGLTKSRGFIRRELNVLMRGIATGFERSA